MRKILISGAAIALTLSLAGCAGFVPNFVTSGQIRNGTYTSPQHRFQVNAVYQWADDAKANEKHPFYVDFYSQKGKTIGRRYVGLEIYNNKVEPAETAAKTKASFMAHSQQHLMDYLKDQLGKNKLVSKMDCFALTVNQHAAYQCKAVAESTSWFSSRRTGLIATAVLFGRHQVMFRGYLPVPKDFNDPKALKFSTYDQFMKSFRMLK